MFFQDDEIGVTLTAYDRITGKEIDIDADAYFQEFFDAFAWPFRRDPKVQAELMTAND